MILTMKVEELTQQLIEAETKAEKAEIKSRKQSESIQQKEE